MSNFADEANRNAKPVKGTSNVGDAAASGKVGGADFDEAARREFRAAAKAGNDVEADVPGHHDLGSHGMFTVAPVR